MTSFFIIAMAGYFYLMACLWRDLRRTKKGDYVSVSSLGNFFSTLENDSDAWIAHQRASSKRVQSIGFNPEGSLWMLSRGAEIRFNEDNNDLVSWSKPVIPILIGYKSIKFTIIFG